MPEPANSALDDARKRARRRLVGAIVLALGAAVVVPLFLESDPKPLGPDVQIQIPAVDDAKFQNRLTPQGKSAPVVPDKAPANGAPKSASQPATNGAAKSAPASESAKSSAVPVSPASPAPPTPDAPAQKSDAAAGAAPPKSAPKSAAEKTAPATPAAAQAAPAEPAPKTVAAAASPKQPEKKAPPPPKAAPAAEPEPTPATNLGTATLNTAPPAATKSGEFVVQLGAFVDKTVATELAAKAGEQGFPVFLEGVTTKNGLVQRVRVGPFPNKAAADAAAAKLVAAGFTAEARPR